MDKKISPLQLLKNDEREQAIADLKNYIKPWDTVYTILRHVSSSGMMRHISVVVLLNGEPRWLDYAVSKATGIPRVPLDKGEGLKMSGCGMDMGFELVYQIGSVLYPKGLPFKEGQIYGRNGDTSGHESDGGYCLQQRWL
jgi:hypothetical protein